MPPGSTDQRLEHLEHALLPFLAPGTAAGALQEAGLWRPGEERNLDAEDWWFRCRFDAPAPVADTETVLRLAGVATMADVWLNGEHVLSSVPAFGHEVTGEHLRTGGNEFVIGVRALAPLLAERRPRPRWRARLVQTQNLRWYRTTLIGRLPAFAPEPAPVGPWRPVVLERRRLVVADELQVRTTVERTDGVVRLRTILRPLGDFDPAIRGGPAPGPSGVFEEQLELGKDGGHVVA